MYDICCSDNCSTGKRFSVYPNPNPNPNPSLYTTLNQKQNDNPGSLILFVTGDIITGAIVARANVGSLLQRIGTYWDVPIQ